MKKIVALLMILAVALMGIGALAEGGTLSVQGVGIVTVDADRATICLGVRESAKDVMTAQNTVNEKMNAVIAALGEAGLSSDAMGTGSIGIYPNYDYSGEVEQIVGYTANNSLVFTVADMDAVGSYIDAAFAAGANSLDYVDFSATDTDEAAERALALAVESARKKAQTLAAAAGVELGDILEIRDNAEIGYEITNAYAASEDAGRGAGTEVLPSRQQVNATVTITFAIGG